METTILPAALAVLFTFGNAWAQDQPAAVPLPQAVPHRAPASHGPVATQASFATPEDGFAALAAAAAHGDVAQVVQILGNASRRLVRSGDPDADKAALERFAASYDVRHDVTRPAPDRATLQIGTDLWPLPIPMVAQDGRWRFDAEKGVQELVDRRIGRNELDTIQTLLAIVDAQDEYAGTAGRQGAFRTYARRFFSHPNQRDGLYWPTAEGAPESPLGPLVAAAAASGVQTPRAGDPPRPVHGYFFRMLEGQGPAAPGGATSYVVGDRMIGGFGVIAWPAHYGDTGIKTFIVNHAGIVYEQDLGPQTAQAAARVTVFNPGEGWSRSVEEQAH